MTDLIDDGFTTVPSALEPALSNLVLIKQIDTGRINGPRIIASGRVNLRGTPEEARAAIRAMAAQGIRFTAEMAVTPEPGATAQELAVLRVAVEEGKRDGVQVVVHAVSTPAMLGATEAGVRHQVHLPNKDFMSYDAARQIAGSGTIVLDLISFGAPLIDVFETDDVPRFRTGLAWPELIAGANRDEQGRPLGTGAAYTLINARRICELGNGLSCGRTGRQRHRCCLDASVGVRGPRRQDHRIPGLGQPIVPAQNSIRYYENVVAAQGGLAATRNFYRLFLVPAMGRTYTFDWFAALEEWVERGQAADVVLLANHIPPPGSDAQAATGPGLRAAVRCAFPVRLP
ncbi:MAG TPA: tannase/feruloyl esterase family alpha/beta hydrolase [Steroidobacteraceae bacterium]|jgi:hypothetical protein|nr:tannase/feruloyl esterase family alpha/beta hydrolase [Steroidobacteraceae bacterium]